MIFTGYYAANLYNHYRLKALLKRTSVQDECIIWTGATDKAGYGRTFYRGMSAITAHRAVWLASGREIPEALELDHTCHNRACVNVEHLRAVTHAENMANRKHKASELCACGLTRERNKRGAWVCKPCRDTKVKAWKQANPKRWREIQLTYAAKRKR